MRIKLIAVTAIFLSMLLIPAYAASLDIQNVRRGVVRVVCKLDEGVSMGTGFVINDGGTIITNHHVIGGSGEIRVLTDDLAEQLKPEIEQRFGDKVKATGGLVSDELEVEILSYIFDKLPAAHARAESEKRPEARDLTKLDLAILECSSKGLSPLSLTRSELVHEGETVYALGYPGKGDRVGVTSFLTLKTYNGVVASKEYNSNTSEKVYQTTAPFSEGNSGGPLADEFGGVIGINSFTISQRIADVELGESLRYSIQIDELIKELDARHIAYKLGSVRSGADWFVRGGIALAIILGLAAVGIATKRGRQVVRDVVDRSRQVAKPAPSPEPVRPGPIPAAFLAGVQGEYAGRMIPLDQHAVVMGRDPSLCQLVFPTSCHQVSKRHCVLRYDPGPGRYLLEDLGSANGTFVTSDILRVRDMRLKPGQSCNLNMSDRFYLGGPETLFELRAAAANNGRPHQGAIANPVPVLRGVKGEYRGKTVQLGNKELIVGRDPGSGQLVISRAAGDVSKRHCSIRYDWASGAFEIADLSSTNGTFVVSGAGPERIGSSRSRRMRPGDRFFLGDPEVLFEVALE